MIVSDSSPLIFIAKLGILPIVCKKYGAICIPEEVFNEVVVEGRKFRAQEIVEIEKAIAEKRIKVIRVEHVSKQEMSGLHIGEQNAIALCKQKKISSLLVDDREAVLTCRLLGISAVRTTRVLLELMKDKLIKRERYEKFLRQLSEEGYFMTAEVYGELLKAGEKVQK
ncbi:MAG: hypothetical protein HY363_06465 [Candidatus Aenigmarchaeota archaeon]|nr:hypothetical protein [Candidatus Aenigmarchaeota archaeon]